jgi:hypothetical protein
MKLTQVTNTWMRRHRGFLTVATIATVLGGTAIAVADVQPLAGTYRASANGKSLPNKGEGCFIEKPTVFGKRVKPAEGNGTICDKQIIAPSLGPVDGVKKGCNKKPAVLNSGGFPIQQAGFHYKGKAPIGPHGKKLTVDFHGVWKTRTKVTGTTKISGGGCQSTVKWTANDLDG